ncbi:hypothetical protein TNCV_2909961 [Trichonephila clavipes]|nr:hypothetical protein TNCV_2909961 [Trichonephila clavipes]
MDYFTKWPGSVPHSGSGSPHRSGGCSAAPGYRDMGYLFNFIPIREEISSLRYWKGVCELLGIDKTKTTPLHPQSDGMVGEV